MNYVFIWKVKGIEVKEEEAYNCYVRDILDKKKDLAIKHGCAVSEVDMEYRPE